MTDKLPYAVNKRDITISKAIGSGELPIDLSTITLPKFVRSILEHCWERKPESRLEITCCQRMMSLQAESIFDAFETEPIRKIPTQYLTVGDGWQAICRPDLQGPYTCELSSMWDNLHLRDGSALHSTITAYVLITYILLESLPSARTVGLSQCRLGHLLLCAMLPQRISIRVSAARQMLTDHQLTTPLHLFRVLDFSTHAPPSTPYGISQLSFGYDGAFLATGHDDRIIRVSGLLG